jgi:hypothetical protein
MPGWLLAEGLEEGELLLVDGIQKVRAGQIVTGQPVEAAALEQNAHRNDSPAGR